MKKILITLLCISLPMLMYAQLDTAITNHLSPAAQQEIANVQKTQQVLNTAKEYSQIAGYGKEIGIAVRDGLYAVKDVTLELADSQLGRTTIWLIVWHVAGKDFVRIALGIVLLLISIILVSRSYFRTFRTAPKTVCIEKTGWWIFGTRKYQAIETKNEKEVIYGSQKFWEYPNAAAIGHVLFLMVFWGISAVIMFA
jgi:hypothetical protein